MNIKKIAATMLSGVLSLASVSANVPLGTSAAEYTGSGDAANAVYKNTITIDTVTLTESEAKAYAAEGNEIEIGVNVGSAGEGVKFAATGLTYYIDERLSTVKTNWGGYVWEDAGTLCYDYGCAIVTRDIPYDVTDENGNSFDAVFVATAGRYDITEAGVFYKFKFKLPEDVSAGDMYAVDIRYTKENSDMFVARYENRDEEAWTFTEGITNGGIIITGDDSTAEYGDANNDGAVDVSDATLIMQSLANGDEYKLDEKGADNADVENRGDGVTAMDALAIQQYLNGSVASLPIE